MKFRRKMAQDCTSGQRVTTKQLLLSFITLVSPTAAAWQPLFGSPSTNTPSTQDRNSHDFSLRHIYHHGTYRDPRLHKKLDVPSESPLWVQAEDESPRVVPHPRLTVRSRSMAIERLKDRRESSMLNHLTHARRTGNAAILDATDWTIDNVYGPNITDKDTVINLAVMAANAYAPVIGQGEWQDVSLGYNHSTSFGWEEDGLRGHIFADKGNQTIIMSLKGTSPAVFDGDGTTTRDKQNDNLFFSCCCAQGGQYFWRQVCDCYSSTYTCNRTCIVKALRQENRYYQAAIELYTNVTELYPDSNIWVVGHSLGGAVSSLLAQTFGIPAVTFEAPGDELAARRLGLPQPPSTDPSRPHRSRYSGSYHIGHTADPIFMGTCNGATATCTLGGYAMESQCHTGLQCVYDTVEDHGWRVGIGYHKIRVVIDTVLKKYPTVPKCAPDDECIDCFNWKYFDSNGSDSTTTSRVSTSTTSYTKTRTTTCKTPGWWGCLDETTTATTTTSTPVATTTYTTTSCATPGWFGCKQIVNVTITTTTAIPTTSMSITSQTTTPTTSKPSSTSTSQKSSTTCDHPGWFGCKDPSSTTTRTSTSSSTARETSMSDECETPGIFWGCYDATTTTTSTSHAPRHTSLFTSTRSFSTSAMTVTSPRSSTQESSRRKCKHRIFFNLICIEWEDSSEQSSHVTSATASVRTSDGQKPWNSEL